jgi:hypothetical protein
MGLVDRPGATEVRQIIERQQSRVQRLRHMREILEEDNAFVNI